MFEYILQVLDTAICVFLHFPWICNCVCNWHQNILAPATYFERKDTFHKLYLHSNQIEWKYRTTNAFAHIFASVYKSYLNFTRVKRCIGKYEVLWICWWRHMILRQWCRNVLWCLLLWSKTTHAWDITCCYFLALFCWMVFWVVSSFYSVVWVWLFVSIPN